MLHDVTVVVPAGKVTVEVIVVDTVSASTCWDVVPGEVYPPASVVVTVAAAPVEVVVEPVVLRAPALEESET